MSPFVNLKTTGWLCLGLLDCGLHPQSVTFYETGEEFVGPFQVKA